MELTVLAAPGCTNGPLLMQRLAQVVAGGPDVTMRRIEIAGIAVAAQHGMHAGLSQCAAQSRH